MRAVCAAGCALLLLLQWKQGSSRLFRDGIGWGWVVLFATLLALVVLFLRSPHPPPDEHPLRLRRNRVPMWMAVVPVLVLITGLSPYLELRTAYAFNMYSNLQTADGESNHLLVTRTVPLTDFESDLVRIKATNEPGLELYATSGFDLPFLQLRAYLSHHKRLDDGTEVSLTYIRAGVEHSIARVRDDPALVEPVPAWQQKLFRLPGPRPDRPGPLPTHVPPRALWDREGWGPQESSAETWQRAQPRALRGPPTPFVDFRRCPSSRWSPISRPPATSPRRSPSCPRASRGRPVPDAARHHRVRQERHGRVDDRAGAEAHAGAGPEQVVGRPAGQRVPRVLPEEPGRVLRQLLRLLPARGVHPVERHVHRERQLGQRRDRPAAPCRRRRRC